MLTQMWLKKSMFSIERVLVWMAIIMMRCCGHALVLMGAWLSLMTTMRVVLLPHLLPPLPA